MTPILLPMKKILVVLIVIRLIGSITAFAAFPPVAIASWSSNFSKVEIAEALDVTNEVVSEIGDSSDEVADFTEGTDEESVVPVTTSYDEEQTDEEPQTTTPDEADAPVFAIIAVQDQNEQEEEQIEELITIPDEADEQGEMEY